jgi:polar amino acid transport system substrate-binding protein
MVTAPNARYGSERTVVTRFAKRHGACRRRGGHRRIGLALLTLATLASVPWRSDARAEALVVGITDIPPFAMQAEDGSWHGLSVVLLTHISRSLGLTLTFREVHWEDMVAALNEGEITLYFGAEVTAAREAVIDFTQPYLVTGLAIAVPKQPRPVLAALAEEVFTTATLHVVWPVALLLLLISFAIWAVERRRNPEQFHPRLVRGLIDGMWWALVTMTTVGYGDKAPRTGVGRALGIVWIFIGLALIALFTAQVTSLFTAHRIAGRVRGVADLPGVRVGVVAGAAYVERLRTWGVRGRTFPDLKDALQALIRDDIDAVVAPEPVLRYQVARAFAGDVIVLDGVFLKTNYACALPFASPLRKPINGVLVEFINSEQWQGVVRTYLGRAN